MVLDVTVDFSAYRPTLETTIHMLRIDRFHRPVPIALAQPGDQVRKIEELSRRLLDGRQVRQAWRKICVQQLRRHLMDSYYTLRKHGVRPTIQGQVRLLRSQIDRQRLYGLPTAGLL